MKKIVIIALFISSIINAQSKKEFTYSLVGIKKVKIESGTSIKIIASASSKLVLSETKHSHNGNSPIINRLVNNHKGKSKSDKRKGLTAIYPGGRDNTNGFGFSVKKEGNVLIIKDLKSHFQRNGIQISLPKTMNFLADSGNLGSIDIEGFTSEIEADSNVGAINIKNVTGPITAHTSVGPITIDFSKVNQTSPITITTSVAEIDVSLPANTNANLELKTRGTVYTNFDFPIPTKKGMKRVNSRSSISGNINKGGVKITLRSSLGNIYLRKK